MVTLNKNNENKCNPCKPSNLKLLYSLILKHISFINWFTIGLHRLQIFMFSNEIRFICISRYSKIVIRFTNGKIECKPVNNIISKDYKQGLHKLHGLHVFLTVSFPV